MNSFKDQLLQSSTAKKRRLCYVQPTVREMIRPPALYKRPSMPIENDTVHNTSYLPIDRDLAKQCRMSAISPEANLSLNPHIKMEKDTVTSISYPEIMGIHRNAIIIPHDRIGMGKGPMQQLTTQKHDFGAKHLKRPEQIRPPNGMSPSTEPMDRDTTTSLSFPKPDRFVPRKNFKPMYEYKKPNICMESETCHKLSYAQNKTSVREIPAWAAKQNFQKPIVPMETTTVQRCSYPPPGTFVEKFEENCKSSFEKDANLIETNSVKLYPKAGL